MEVVLSLNPNRTRFDGLRRPAIHSTLPQMKSLRIDSRTKWMMALAVYPQNLSLAICSPCAFDLESYNQLLHIESHRIFLSNNELRVKVIEIGSRG